MERREKTAQERNVVTQKQDPVGGAWGSPDRGHRENHLRNWTKL